MKTYHDQFEFAQEQPEAYKALPEAYKNDSCLLFFQTEDGMLLTEPKPDQAEVLGDRTFVYHNKFWYDLKFVISKAWF